MNSEFVKTRAGLAEGKLGYVVTDSPVAIRIWNKAGKAVTHVIVTTAVGIELHDADGTSGSLSFDTYTTMGAVADAINQLGNWECKVLDVLRSEISKSRLVDGSIAAHTLANNGVSVYDVKLDTNTAFQFSFCATVDRNIGGEKAGKMHRIHLRKLAYAINVGTAAPDKVQVWKRKGGLEEQILSALSVDTTATTVFDYTTGMHKGITAVEGEEFVVLVKDAGGLADDPTNLLTLDYLVE